MRIRPVVTLTLVAGALTLPGTALALGLGKLTVESSLGQPLSARIELTSAAGAELDSLTARVADPSLYRQNNLAYQPVLARARVTLERAANGQAYLVVVTSSAVNEPYLDLMVEMNWASGRVVRDYTFLLDPPGVAPQPVEPVAPVRPGTAPPRPAAAAPAGAATPAAAPAGGAGGAAGSYTVKRGDTLSRIAGDTKPPSVTLEQMLVALWKQNQQAFDGNNLNRLRAGAIMTIPGADEAGATSPTEATEVVRLQAVDWRAYRDRVAANAPVSEGAGTRGGGGKIGTVVEESVPAAVPGRDQLRVSREAASGKAGASAAAETAIARDKQIREQQERIAELEKTIRDLQRVAELKSQTLAQMQAQADQKAAPAKAAPAPEAKSAAAPAAAPAVAKTAEPPPVPITAATPKAEPAPASKAEAPAKVEPAPAPKAAPLKAEPPKPPPSFFEDLLANVPIWAIGGGALVVLGGIAALIAARRRKPAKFEDGITTDTDIKSNTVFGSTGGGIVNTGDNSLSSEFSREGLGNIDTDEVDPIAEAEVYLAYGRDAQAEEILKDALRKDPDRQEVYLKLLEIHAQHNKPSSFETVAAELYAVSHGQGDVWQKALALGRQLDPNNPMFAEASAGATEGAAAAAPGDTQSFSVPPELTSEVTLGRDTVAPAASARRDNVYDLGLDDDVAKATTHRSAETVAATETAPVTSLRDATTASPAFARTAAAAATAALVDGIAKSAKPAPAPSELPVIDKLETTNFVPDLEFRLDDAPALAPAADTAAAAPKSGVAPSTAAQPHADFGKLDLAFNDERSTFEDATPSVLDGQWHDAATKLDLAKAYQEMGDVEGAREILQEVLREGDDEQKTEAQALIAKLG